MRYEIRIKKSAVKELSNLPKSLITRISSKIDDLSENPFPVGYKKLKGTDRYYRLRIGDYRIIYAVEQEVLIIEIIRIQHRKVVYR